MNVAQIDSKDVSNVLKYPLIISGLFAHLWYLANEGGGRYGGGCECPSRAEVTFIVTSSPEIAHVKNQGRNKPQPAA